MIKIKRAYEPREKGDGYRVLIDRLWPRGLKKNDLPLNSWAKDLAPSNDLRKSFAHNPKKWAEFRARYRQELWTVDHRKMVDALIARARRANVTLVFSARDAEHNNAVVLKSVIERKMKR